MSDDRDPDFTFKLTCPINRQQIQTLECFKAYKFRVKLRHGNRNCSPPITTRNKDWFLENMYRIRRNGKFGKGYVFFTIEEIQRLQINFIKGE